MNFVEQDFELGFPLFKTPASFLMDANLIPCASFAVGGLSGVGVWLAGILIAWYWYWIGSGRLWVANCCSGGYYCFSGRFCWCWGGGGVFWRGAGQWAVILWGLDNVLIIFKFPKILSLKLFGDSWGNSCIPCLYVIIVYRFTCGERRIWWNIEKSQNIMKLIVE